MVNFFRPKLFLELKKKKVFWNPDFLFNFQPGSPSRWMDFGFLEELFGEVLWPPGSVTWVCLLDSGVCWAEIRAAWFQEWLVAIARLSLPVNQATYNDAVEESACTGLMRFRIGNFPGGYLVSCLQLMLGTFDCVVYFVNTGSQSLTQSVYCMLDVLILSTCVCVCLSLLPGGRAHSFWGALGT